MLRRTMLQGAAGALLAGQARADATLWRLATGYHAELGEVIMTGLAKEMPIAGADAVPFVTRHYDDVQRLWLHQRPLVEPVFAARGLRMRTYNATTVRMAELLGAVPVDVAMVDVGRAVAEGRIDTMITSAVTGVENRVRAGLKFFYEINARFPKNAVLAAESALRSLPAPPLALHLRRLGERFALEWIREVGPRANAIFIPYHSSSTS